jgi:lactaldehyde dehydrogenase
LVNQKSHNSVQVRNPYTNEILATLECANSEKIAKTVGDAEEAFQTVALQMTPYDRYELLFSVSKKIHSNRDELACLISMESGKPIRDSFIEVDRAQQTLLFSAEAAKNIRGEAIPCDVTPIHTGKVALTSRVPLGVLAAISPFNFPLNLVVHKVGPGIAAGNAVILKPSSQTPLTAIKLRDFFLEAGCHPGLFQLVIGPGSVGEDLACQDRIRLVSFTGSVSVGKRLSSKIGMKKIVLELGGNDPLLVMADGNLEDAASVAVEQGVGTNGQRCTAVKRVLVHEAVAEKFNARVVNIVKALRVGDPLDPETDVGPLITVDAAIEVEKRINEAVKSGAALLCGGSRDGATISPTVLKDVDPGAELVKEETFGPVIPIMTFSDIEEATRICNGTQYGLQAGVFTSDLNILKRMFRDLEVGAVVSNQGPGFRIEHLPFGGTKMSGHGREGIRYALEEMTEIKTMIF